MIKGETTHLMQIIIMISKNQFSIFMSNNLMFTMKNKKVSEFVKSKRDYAKYDCHSVIFKDFIISPKNIDMITNFLYYCYQLIY